MANFGWNSFGDVLVMPSYRPRCSLASAAMPGECGRGGNPDFKA
jgi:hypothetical protein